MKAPGAKVVVPVGAAAVWAAVGGRHPRWAGHGRTMASASSADGYVSPRGT